MAGRRIIRRSNQARYLKGSRINWISVIIAAALLSAVVIGVVFLVRFALGLNEQNDPTLATAQITPGETATVTVYSTNTPLPTEPPGSSEENPLDLSQDAEKVIAKGNSINIPCIYENNMVFSAGSGSINDHAVLTTLYEYNLETGEEQEIAQAQIKNGEIFDTLINSEYIVWLDTDQNGKNQIYFRRRHDAEEEGNQLIKECDHAMPKLRLSKDSLIFTEQYQDPQTNSKEEMLYHVDLITGEDVALPNYTESILGQETTYAVSAPDIYGDEVIWAAPDPAQSDEERAVGEQSVIFSCDLEQLKNDDYSPEMWKAGMYVHEPITNGKAWAWIDRNKAPDSTLWVKYGDQVTRVSTGVTTYCFGDSMLVYGKEGTIWVYFYETGKYGRITREGERGILPVATGRKVVWFDRTPEEIQARGSKDQLMIVYIP